MVTGVFSIPLDADCASPRGHSRRALALREFIAGEENALLRIAEKMLLGGPLLDGPEPYNPIVFYGPTGTGKTLLARGLAARYERHSPQKKTISLAASDYARAYARAVETDAVTDFRRRFRHADLLLLEDLGELAGKTAAQDELARIIDHRTDHQRQTLVTSTRVPNQIEKLSPALASRLTAGLSIPLARPAAATRRVIVSRLVEQHDIDISEDASQLLAERLNGTVPELNHALVQMASKLDGGGQIGVELVEAFLSGNNPLRQPTLRIITSRVGRYFQIKSSDLKGPSRRQPVVFARSVAMYLARQLTDHSLDEVGRHFGGRDHTTVLHACRKIESRRAVDRSVGLACDEITRQL